MTAIRFNIELQPKQSILSQYAENSPATWIGYGGSRGGAKSYGIDAVMLIRRWKYPGTVGCILRRTFDLVRENHIDPMIEHWPVLNEWYNTTYKQITFPNKSKIVFRSAENAGDVKAMIGKQYTDMMVDQAEEFSEEDLVTMKSCVRWPRLPPSTLPKFILAFNPGNIGAPFLKRVFVDKQYREKEDPRDYAFIQAHGWDNVEWASPELRKLGIEQWQYYHQWTEDQRFEFFIKQTAYGRDLNAKPKALRLAWLMGSFERFVGQYFDARSFNPDRHVKRIERKSYGSLWLAIDWGFAHNAACLWFSQITKRTTSVFRELVKNGRSPKSLAQEICDATPSEEKKRIAAIYLSWDAFAKRGEPETIALQMGQVFRQNGMPWPTRASRDRGDAKGHYGGPALIYDMFQRDELFIDPSCEETIKVIPMITRDDTNPEKTVSFEGDDAFDALVYGTKDRLAPAKPPRDSKIEEEAERISDPIARHYFLLKKALDGPVPGNVESSIPSPWGGSY